VTKFKKRNIMSKRPPIDLLALTSEQATPMPEAAQRTASSELKADTASKNVTASLQPLAFKVSPEFRKRFKQRAFEADMKLNELLFAALDAWEDKQGITRKNS
jgi:hypothetical protein